MLITKKSGYVCRENQILKKNSTTNASTNRLNYNLDQKVSMLYRQSKFRRFIYNTETILDENFKNLEQDKSSRNKADHRTIEEQIQTFSREITDNFASDAMQAYVDKYYKTTYRYQKSIEKFAAPPPPSLRVYMEIVSKQIETMENISDELLEVLYRKECTETERKEILEKKMKYQLARINDAIHQYEISGALAALKAQGVKHYQIVNESGQSCERCDSLIGKPIEVDKIEAGENAPLFHPNCRCTIGSYVENIESGFAKWMKSIKNSDRVRSLGARYLDVKTSNKRYEKHIEILQKYIGSYESRSINGRDYFFSTDNLQNPIFLDGKLIKPESATAIDVELLKLMKKRGSLPYGSEYNQLILEAYAIMSQNQKTITVDFFKPFSYYEMGRDVTNEIYKLMRDCNEKYKYSTFLEGSWVKIIPEFNRIVQNGGEMDLKNRPEFQNSGFVFDGEIVDQDALGNITYGFFGKVLLIPDDVLMRAAGVAQKSAGTSRPEFEGTFDDDPRDQLRILQGIEIYNKLYKNKE